MDELLREYNKQVPNLVWLKKKVAKKLERYNEKVQEMKTKQRAPKEPDEDGWITVRHKGGRDPTRLLTMKEKSKKKKKKERKVVNFYAFEIKESKLRRHQELLAKFEEDKQRLARMRGQRKFKI